MGAVLGVLFKVLAIVPGVVHGIEGLFGAKKGGEKKEAAMMILRLVLTGALAAVPGLKLDSDKVTSGVSKVIDGLVDVFNGAGVFQKS